MIDQRFYHKSRDYLISEIVSLLNLEVIYHTYDEMINDVATLEKAKKNTVAMCGHHKYLPMLKDTQASLCIVDKNFISSIDDKINVIVTHQPHFVFAQILELFYPIRKNPFYRMTLPAQYKVGKDCSIEKNVVIGNNVTIGDNVHIHSGSYIGDNVVIGNNNIIGPNCTINYSIIGDNNVIHTGCAIGQEGFGFKIVNGKSMRIMQLGRVVIGNHVEIGANCCIDRGALDDTVIGDVTHIDSNVKIAHNVKIGKYCMIAAQVGIAGSTIIDDQVAMGGQVGIAGHLHIGKNIQIAAQSGVMRDVKSGSMIGGSPAVDIEDWHRSNIAIKKLSSRRSKKNES